MQGLMVVDEPTQMVSLAAETVGLGLTNIALVCAEQPVAVFVNVNRACPAPTAVTTPTVGYGRHACIITHPGSSCGWRQS